MSKVRRIYVEKKDAYAVQRIPTTKRRLPSSQSRQSMSYMKNHSL